jgi:hypothetical protein
MREIKFKTLSFDGSTVDENKIVINEGEMLIMQPTYEMTFERLHTIHMSILKALQGKVEFVTLPYGIEFKTLKITDENVEFLDDPATEY